jgi:hypothetical protein
VRAAQPRVFESFVEVLFDIISHINAPGDRVLRAAVRLCPQTPASVANVMPVR